MLLTLSAFICVYLRLLCCFLVVHLRRTPGALPDIPTPYLPSTTVAVDEMLRLADVGPADLVADLGSGDGRVVIAAARDYGARGLGIELDPKLVAESRMNAQQAGVADRVTFRQGDVLVADYRDATVVTLYLLPNLVEKLKPRLLELKPGTRIVAHDYGFSDWKPDRRIIISKTYLLYVVPARVAGKWRLHFSPARGRARIRVRPRAAVPGDPRRRPGRRRLPPRVRSAAQRRSHRFRAGGQRREPPFRGAGARQRVADGRHGALRRRAQPRFRFLARYARFVHCGRRLGKREA